MLAKLLNKFSNLSFETATKLIGCIAFGAFILGFALLIAAVAVAVYLINNSSL
jgi:hypothetical protein